MNSKYLITDWGRLLEALPDYHGAKLTIDTTIIRCDYLGQHWLGRPSDHTAFKILVWLEAEQRMDTARRREEAGYGRPSQTDLMVNLEKERAEWRSLAESLETYRSQLAKRSLKLEAVAEAAKNEALLWNENLCAGEDIKRVIDARWTLQDALAVLEAKDD